MFAVLSRAGSLGKTAKTLGIDHSTVSRRLAALEDSIGTQLAVRNPSGLELTDAGEAVATAARGFEELVGQLTRRIGGEDARAEGVVRLSTTPGFAPFLLRGLGQLRDQHPGIRVEVLPRLAALDLLRREADLAIRLFRDRTASLLTRKIGELGWGLYASDDYLNARDAELGSASLEGHEVIAYDAALSALPGAAWLQERLGDRAPVMTCGDPASALAAALAGLGVTAIPCFMAVGLPHLRRLTPDIIGRTEVFLVIPPDHKNTTRVRITADFIAAYAEKNRSLLEGRLGG